MKRIGAWLVGAWVMIAAPLQLVSGCDSDDDDSGAGGTGSEPVDTSDVIYEAEATDEALEALLAKDPEQGAAEAAVLDAPTNGEALSSRSAPTFRWHAGGGATLSPPSLVPSTSGQHRLGWARRALEPLLAGVSVAHAHGTPVNGPGYLLVLSTDDDDKLLRVFTLDTEFTPNADAWDTIRGAGKPVTATIVSAEFESNRVLQDGGPWQSAPVTFTVSAR